VSENAPEGCPLETDPLLFKLALESSNTDVDYFLKDLNNPIWSGRAAGWGACVPSTVAERWPFLSVDTKLAVFMTANLAYNLSHQRDY
jgi:hypothetical protein